MLESGKGNGVSELEACFQESGKGVIELMKYINSIHRINTQLGDTLRKLDHAYNHTVTIT